MMQVTVMKDDRHHHQLPLTISIIHIAIRISLANKAPITDCDEVYNYWEPLHYLNYGSGMQTWEYAPQYALRTYAYLLPLSFLSKFYDWMIGMFISSSSSQGPFILELVSNLVSPFSSSDSDRGFINALLLSSSNKVLIFHLLRASIAFMTSIAELRLVNAIASKYSKSTAILTWFMLLTSTGMFHTAPAFLPSSTAMICIFHSLTEQIYSCSNGSYHHVDGVAGDDSGREDDKTYMLQKLDYAIIYGLAAILMTGWPFCAILFIPLGIFATIQNYMLTNQSFVKVLHLYLRVALYAVAIQAIVMSIDYKYYAKLISPTVNIFIYNTGLFSGDDGGDGINRDELYGVEDVSYYIKNLILNWNIAAIIVIASLPLLSIYQLLQKSDKSNEARRERTITLLVLLPMILWIGIVFSRPHKEERFLFPVYPMIAVGTALVIDKVLDVILSTFCRSVQNQNGVKVFGGLLFLVPFALISISRSVALSDGYTAPLKLYTYLYHHLRNENSGSNGSFTDPMLVCTCGEWYRFPSSYHLPNTFQLAYLKSSFGGQLPQQFTQHGSKDESLSVQSGKFNDLNEEEVDRYVDISDCAYVIELLHKPLRHDSSSECLKYMKEDKSGWVEVKDFNFLDSENTSLLHRVLFVPFKRKVNWKSYTLFKRKQFNNDK